MKIIFILFCLFVTVLAEAKSKIIHVPSRFGHWNFEISVALPKNTNLLQGVVVLIPGGDGFGDPSISDAIGTTPKKNLGLSAMGKEIIQHGFAYASFNTRGMYPLDVCLKNVPIADRKKVLIKKCLNRKIRSSVDWVNMESDILEIFKAIKKQENFKNTKIVLLAHSEGGMHISRLIRSQQINPHGIVGLGVPSASPFNNSRLQSTLSIYLNRLLEYIETSHSEQITSEMIDQIFPSLVSEHRTTLLKLTGTNGLNREGIEQYLSVSTHTFDSQLERVLGLNRSITLGGEIMGEKIDVAISAGWWTDALSDKIDLATSLKNYQGRRIFFYGENDFQVGHDRLSACGKPEESYNCEFRIIPEVGHSLEGKNDIFAKTTIDAIVRAIIDVTHQN